MERGPGPAPRPGGLNIGGGPSGLESSLGSTAGPGRARTAEVHDIRKRNFSRSLSVSYANVRPLHMVRGEKQYLFDEAGRKYLDTRNNVPHVGHTHPRVVRAVQEQVGVLNTNTRYLHENMAFLSERLLRHCRGPGGGVDLDKVFLVNSGSEANDLALRLAEARTGRRGAVVIEHAYHGHSMSVVDISPYKWLEQKPHIHVLPAPVTEAAAERGIALLEELLKQQGEQSRDKRDNIGAFFMESGMSVAGVIIPPENYLRRIYKLVRDFGGVCVADEVQTGFGRFGDVFWGYEHHGVVPDIVTTGKPFGNGMPLAAVITTEQLANSLQKEYFNTFGGNPVCCAAGLAVLEVLEEERLQEHALRVGGRFMKRVGEELSASKLPVYVGDVRGRGLFIGVEFRRRRRKRKEPGDREDDEPATAETSLICVRMMTDYCILTSIDGPADNVLVIKPPMCFSEENAEEVVMALKELLGKFESGELVAGGGVGHTPT